MTSDGQRGGDGSITALVVDDSAFMRATITDLLERNGIQVVAEASDGYEAVVAVEESTPDVITMDISMPRMDGLKAVEVIMNRRPTPILMLSSHAGAEADVTFEALERGAVDFVQKPSGEVSTDLATVEDRLIETVETVAHTTPPSPAELASSDPSPTSTTNVQTDTSPILAIAASTGGPTVLERIFSELPLDVGFRVIVVQHMPETFTGRFAKRLDDASAYQVTEATDGTVVDPGEAVVAPGGYHLVVDEATPDRLRISLDDGQPVHNVKPAADITLESLAEHESAPVIGAVVTGMGTDGARGLEELSEHGARIVAQDEETSTVFGMPRRAIERGCVDRIESAEGLVSAFIEEAPAASGTAIAGGRRGDRA